MSLLKLDSVEFTYEGKLQPVLNDISIDIDKGEFISIVGPSGSGKTTLLRMLAGHLNPNSGNILFHGEPMEGPDVRLVPGYEEIRLVYQQYELRPNISAKENLNAALHGFVSDYRIERVDFLLDFFSLTHVSSHKPYELSGGQQQRLAIGMAMANEPEVLLLDEPFSALDPMNSAIFLKEIKRLAMESNTAVILVTHDTRDAMMADRVVVLMNGKIRQEGTPDDIYYRPCDFEVASFFGPINRLSPKEMKLFGLQEEGDCCVRAEGFKILDEAGEKPFLIQERIFRGSYQILVVELLDRKTILVFDPHNMKDEAYERGQRIALEIKKDSLITF